MQDQAAQADQSPTSVVQPSRADRRAIDLLLDLGASDMPGVSDSKGPDAPAMDGSGDRQAPFSTFSAGLLAGGSATMSTYFAPGDPGDISPERLAAVERVLDVLSQMPAMDPPADLVARTMNRVEEARDTASDYSAPSASLGSAPTAVPNQRPVMDSDAPEG